MKNLAHMLLALIKTQASKYLGEITSTNSNMFISSGKKQNFD